MDEHVIEGLKQFIAATVSQAMTDVATKSDIVDTKNEITKLRSEMKRGFEEVQSAIADTMTTANRYLEERVENHVVRLKQLEPKTA